MEVLGSLTLVIVGVVIVVGLLSLGRKVQKPVPDEGEFPSKFVLVDAVPKQISAPASA